MRLLNKINALKYVIPEKDKTYFENFINERKFDCALDLVNSIITSMDINLDSPHPLQQYVELNKRRTELILLQTYLNNYLEKLNISIEDDYSNN